jgi:hypothetical protein
MPGFTGTSGGGETAAWIQTSFDLSAYAGQTILLSFRYVTDSGVDLPGWWIDDVAVGSVPLADGSSLEGWQSPTQISPVPVSGFTVQLVAYSTKAVFGRPLFPVRVYTLPLDGQFHGSLDRIGVLRNLGPLADVVAAIVTYDDPSESVDQYAPYTLTVEGVLQPGGS